MRSPSGGDQACKRILMLCCIMLGALLMSAQHPATIFVSSL